MYCDVIRLSDDLQMCIDICCILVALIVFCMYDVGNTVWGRSPTNSQGDVRDFHSAGRVVALSATTPVVYLACRAAVAENSSTDIATPTAEC